MIIIFIQYCIIYYLNCEQFIGYFYMHYDNIILFHEYDLKFKWNKIYNNEMK